jgi:hypothetical protein
VIFGQGFLPIALDKSISNCKAAVLVLVPPGILFSRHPDIIDFIEKKRLQWCDYVKRMPEERIPLLIMEWIPEERRKRGRPRKSWMEGVQAA